MFKFVVPSPSTGLRHLSQRDAVEACVKEEPRYSLSYYLNKQQDKGCRTFLSKGGHDAYAANLVQDISTSKTQATSHRRTATTKTNTKCCATENAVTLEENDGERNPQRIVASRYGTTEGELISRESTRQIRLDTGSHCKGSTTSSCAKGKYYLFPKGKRSGRAVNKPRPKSAGDVRVIRRFQRGDRMAQNCYSVSDSESDAAWLDQPSPILLTSSPPHTALRVPATRATSSPLTNGFQYESPVENNDCDIDENSNYLRNKFKPSLSNDVEQEASNLFCTSLKKNERFVKSVPNRTNHVQKRLLPQEPYSFTRPRNGYYDTAAPSPTASNTSGNVDVTESHSATSGPLFLGGPLFLTDEGCDEDYIENAPREGMTKDASGTQRTITEPLYSITDYNRALCLMNGGMTFHSHIDMRGVENSKTMNGNAGYYDLVSTENSSFKDIISVNKAEVNRPDLSLYSNVSKASAPSSEMMNHRKPNDYFDMNEIITTAENSRVKQRTRRPLSSKIRNSRKQNRQQDLSDEDDDDATTITMVTNSDSDQELSSSSSSDNESTTRESMGSVKTFPSGDTRQEACDPVTNVEHVERYSTPANGTEIYSVEERRASLRRSISTQSGKLRERLNATIDDEQSVDEIDLEENTMDIDQYSGIGNDMMTSNQASTSPKYPHYRVSALKGENSPRENRGSRSLTRLSPQRDKSPSQSRRCRSLDRGFRGSFRSALSPAHSDLSGRRSFNLRRRDSLESGSEISFNSSLGRRPKLRRTPSTGSLGDRYKPKIDVAESLSALILNPVMGGENDRKTLSEYLKHSSWNSSKDAVAYSSEELRWSSNEYNHPSFSPGFIKGVPESLSKTLDTRLNFDDHDPSVLSRTSTSGRNRESRFISKSQTPDRYPAVGAFPRSISALVRSPRSGGGNAETEVITITDNEVPANETELIGRRNSFIEAVTGNSSDYAHSSKSELTDGEDVEQAFKDLAVAAEEASLTPRNTTVEGPLRRYNGVPESPGKVVVFPEEVGLNFSKDPISRDLTVAVVRRPSTRSQSTSSEPASPAYKQRVQQNQTFAPINSHLNNETVKPLLKPEPTYVNVPGDQLDSPLADIVTVKCRNSRCRKEMCLEDAKTKFKSCHHCYTYYCSQQCRLAHWEKHKLKCIFARVNSDCKKILRVGRDSEVVRQAFTRVARTGYLSRGRGCVQVIFSCPEKAENFISEGLFALESLPLYRTVHELRELKARLIKDSDLITDALIETAENSYDPEKSYVLQVLIDIPDETLAMYERPYRHQNSHGVYIHTINPVYKSEQDSPSPKESTTNTPETLILTPPTTIPETWLTSSPSGFSFSTSSSSGSLAPIPKSTSGDASRDAKRARQLCFINIQRKLRDKGVTLRHQYPDVYRKLCSYVDTGAHFTPVVIYPQDTKTGKNFMCLVMPGSEPQILGWVDTPGLLDDIATG